MERKKAVLTNGGIINIGSMSNSQLQQASPHSNQGLTIINDIDSLCSILNSLKSKSSELGLGDESHQELSSEVDTVLVQAKSPKPKTNIIIESLKSIRTILEAAAGNVVASSFLSQLGRFF